MWTWYVDRGAGLVAYAVLWFAVFSGILYNAKGFGALHRVARAAHVPASVLASVTLLLHVAFGLVDTWAVVSAQVPHPAYSDAWLGAGLAVGVSALMLVVTSILGFIDPKKFERPWDPRAVHALAYGGFAFATIHVIALGSDVGTFLTSAAVAASAFLLWVLVLRFWGSRAEPARAGKDA